MSLPPWSVLLASPLLWWSPFIPYRGKNGKKTGLDSIPCRFWSVLNHKETPSRVMPNLMENCLSFAELRK
jgi:hypothetical protein